MSKEDVSLKDIVRNTLKAFCTDFVDNPYLCYTEHGMHALYFNRLYSNMPEPLRYFKWNGRKICSIQKEYPTASDLDKPKRQNWDISIIATPPNPISETHPYDYFKLDTVIEFGLNEPKEHLIEDIRRLTHPKANVNNKYIVHLYRISNGVSGRDWSMKSKRILSETEIKNHLNERDVEIYFGISDITNTITSGLWIINKN